MTQCGIAFPEHSRGLSSRVCGLPPRPLPPPLLPEGKSIWPKWDRWASYPAKHPQMSVTLGLQMMLGLFTSWGIHMGLGSLSLKKEDISWDQTSGNEEHPARSYSLVDSNCFSTKSCQDFNSMCSQQECWPINKSKIYRRSISSYKEGQWLSIRVSHWVLQTLKV